MLESYEARPRNERGFTLIELLVVVLIIGLLSAIAVPGYQRAIRKARIVALVADARNLHDALTKYHVDQNSYPTEFGPGAFDTSTIEPLASLGYFPQVQGFVNKLESGKIWLYFAPDIGGKDGQYAAVMRHALDKSLVVLAADTSLFGGYLDGVYVQQGGVWVRVDEVDE